MQIGLEKMFDILAIPAYGEKKPHKKGIFNDETVENSRLVPTQLSTAAYVILVYSLTWLRVFVVSNHKYLLKNGPF